MFKTIEQAQQNNTNPAEFFKQITNKRSPEQMNTFYKKVEQMGFSPDVINRIRYWHNVLI